MECKIAIQAFSFRLFTFYEAIEKTAALGLKYIEAYPWQPLSPERADVTFSYELPKDIRDEVKTKLAASDVKLINYGVTWLPEDEAQHTAYFDFVKEMGVETLVMEPAEESLDYIEARCQEYDLRAAIHNHPTPSHYWHPDTVARVCAGRSPCIGACPDTGHWVRSGVDPIEGLRALEGRIMCLHVKDLDRPETDANIVPWGMGAANVAGQFEELARQAINPVVAIEYEDKWEDSMAEIRQCTEFYNRISND